MFSNQLIARLHRPLLLLAGVILLLLIAEGLTRFRPHDPLLTIQLPPELQEQSCIEFDPAAGWKLKGNLRDTEAFDTRITTNSHGLRATRELVKKRPWQLRVLVLGDAVPFGAGLPIEEAWPSLLEKKLQEELYRGRDIEVVNAACPGDSLIRAEARMDALWSIVRPDFVVVQSYGGDIAFQGFRDVPELAGGLTGFLRSWAGRSQIAAAWMGRRLAAQRFPAVESAGLPRVSLEDYGATALRMFRTCKKRDARFAILTGVRHGASVDAMENERAGEYAKGLHWTAGWNLMPAPEMPQLEGSTNPDDARFFQSRLLPNAAGHQLLLDTVVNTISAEMGNRLNEIAEAFPERFKKP